MTRNPNLKSINCTQCGAGLDVLGGGRVQVNVCGYCGSELDAQDNFAVLRRFTEMERPYSPFRIGMQGDIDGVTFTVIGTLGMQERWRHMVWQWVDHQLYSPTHGYAYLTYESGHLTLSRRYRGPVNPGWIGPLTVETAETRPTARAGGQPFQYFETSTSEITFVEGEFNWRPRLGAESMSVSMLGRDAMLSYSKSATEEEILMTRYLPAAEIYAAFGVQDGTAAEDFHVLKPYRKGPHQTFFALTSGLFAVIALVLAMNMGGASGTLPRIEKSFAVSDLPQEIPFVVEQADQVARIRVSADVDNSWAFIGLSVTDPEDVPLFEAGRTVERYSGRDKDGAWSEGWRTSTLRFIPRQVGTYTVEVAVEEADTWQRTGSPVNRVTVEMQQGLISTLWLQLLALAFGTFSLFQLARPFLHQYRRMKEGDWSDD